MKQHIHDCPKRQVRCRNGCNAQMEQRYRDNHEQQMCTHRTVEVTVVLCRRLCVCVLRGLTLWLECCSLRAVQVGLSRS